MAAHAPRTALLDVLQAVLGILIATALVLGGWIGWFCLHSDQGGAQLLVQARHRIQAADHAGGPGTGCRPPTGAVGELVVPRLGLIAPIVQGDGEAQLADAVGHVPTSVWPGDGGTTVFVAHDVTWFHELDRLPAGSEIEYVSGCRAMTYRVTTAGVVTAGAPVANVAGHLALVTCWPLDALWFTGQRFLVQAIEIGGASRAPAVRLPAAPPVPLVDVPATLAAVDSLDANPTPLGALTVSGRPSPSYEESPGPLADAAAVQTVFFAAQRAAEASDAGGWSAVAPGVPAADAGPLAGTAVTGFGQPLTTTLQVTGDELAGGTVSVEERLAGRSGGDWRLTVTEGVTAGQLAVTGWAMRAG